MQLVLRAMLTLVILAFAGVAEARKWTDVSGKYSIDAELVVVKNGKAYLEQADGKVIAIPLDRLSDADREFINASEASKPNKPPQTVKELTPDSPAFWLVRARALVAKQESFAPEQSAAIYAQIAEAFVAAGDAAGALETIKLIPKAKSVWRDRELQRVIGLQARIGDVQAVKETLPLIDTLPEPLPACFLAIAHAQAGKFDAARQLLADVDPSMKRTNPRPLDNAAFVVLVAEAESLARAGKLDAAKQLAEKLNGAEPAAALARAIAQIQVDRGDLAGALATMQGHGSSFVELMMQRDHLARGNIDAALRLAQALHKREVIVNDHVHEAYVAVARAQAKAGDKAAAARTMEIVNSNSALRGKVAAAYCDIGDIESAKRVIAENVAAAQKLTDPQVKAARLLEVARSVARSREPGVVAVSQLLEQFSGEEHRADIFTEIGLQWSRLGDAESAGGMFTIAKNIAEAQDDPAQRASIVRLIYSRRAQAGDYEVLRKEIDALPAVLAMPANLSAAQGRLTEAANQRREKSVDPTVGLGNY